MTAVDVSGRRSDGRLPNELRQLQFQRDYTTMADGSVLVSFGETRVLCTASVDDDVPRWIRQSGAGWLTAEYSMLPGSSPQRIARRVGGRTKEIQRLIGRSLRMVIDLKALPQLQVTIDCDVLQADGGTRTASICGGYLALHDAVTRLVHKGTLKESPMTGECAAVSVGLIDGVALLDLPYSEDANADVDFNVVMSGAGELIEVQGTAEGRPFSRLQLDELMDLASEGITEILKAQRVTLAQAPVPR